MRTRLSIALAVAGAALALAGCGKVVEGRVETAMREDLRRLIGPAEDYDVDVRGLNLRSGTADGATVIGRRVQAPDAPMLDYVEVVLHDVRYDLKARQLESVGSAAATVRLRPDDIAEFMGRIRNVKDAAITVAAPNEATVRLRPEFREVDLPAGLTLDAVGRLAADGPRVRFDLDRVGAAGFRVGGAAADAVTRAINPIVDLSGLPFGVDITTIEAGNGLLTVKATATYRAP